MECNVTVGNVINSHSFIHSYSFIKVSLTHCDNLKYMAKVEIASIRVFKKLPDNKIGVGYCSESGRVYKL